MHRLVPQFILRKQRIGQMQGEMEAVALFIDILGFTALTESLMANGSEGAEVLADTLQVIFTPVVETIYSQHGFISSFAGDALIALFPIANEHVNTRALASSSQKKSVARGQIKKDPHSGFPREEALHHALNAALQIKERMAFNKEIQTHFGHFTFAVKISLAWGNVSWRIWQAGEGSRFKQRCAYAFVGEAIDQAMAGDALVGQSQILLSQAICKQLPRQVEWQPSAGGRGFLLKLPSDMLIASPTSTEEHPKIDGTVESQAMTDGLTDFYSPQLLGTPLRGEFRPIVTLFLGIQRLSAPSAQDAIMPLILARLEQYGGYLCRVDRSQGINRLLIFWGAPISYENNLERALEFCLTLRREIAIPIRAGLTYQIGYAGFIGSERRAEYTCYGIQVNLAARQMAAAPWHEIWLDQEIARRVSHTFELVDLDVQHFKGFTHPQPVTLLKGLRADPGDQFFHGQIWGREREIQILQKAIAPIFTGKFAGFVALIGEAGIGKSRLFAELLQTIKQTDQSIQWIRCNSDEILRQALNPFRYHLHTYFEQSRIVAESKNKANFNALLDLLLAQLPDRALAGELDRTRSALGAIIDLHWPDSFYEQLERHLRFENMLLALKNYLLARSLLGPLILLLDDAQWLDEDSRFFLQRLSRNIDPYPIAVLIASREEFQLESVPIQFLPIEPLPVDVIRALAKDRINKVLSPEHIEQLVTRTEGNPLFIEQFLYYLSDSNRLSQQMPLSLPDDAQAVLVARLDRLDGDLRRVVQTAAVLGQAFDAPILRRILSDLPDVQAQIRAATDESIWYALDDMHYFFRHTLIREAAYGMQLKGRLREIHATAASAIESLYSETLTTHYGEVAYHYEQAGEIRKALDYSYQAGQIARENYKNREALEHYKRMLTYLTPGDHGRERLAVLQQQAEVLRFIDRYDDALHALREAAQLGTNLHLPLEIGKVSSAMGSIELLKGEFEKAHQLLKQGANLLEVVNAHSELGHTYRELGNVWEGLGNYDQASSYYQQALDAYDRAKDPFGQARTLIGLGIVAWSEGAFELAAELYKESRRIFERLKDSYNAAIANTNLANIALVRKDWATAKNLYQSSLETFSQCGNTMSQATILGNLGIVHQNMGDNEAARACNETSYKLNWEIGSLEGAIYNKINLANLALLTEEQHEARTNIRAALQLANQLRSPRLMLEALLPTARYYLAITQPEKALFLCKLIRSHPATHAYLLEMLDPIQADVEAKLEVRSGIELGVPLGAEPGSILSQVVHLFNNWPIESTSLEELIERLSISDLEAVSFL